LVFTIRSAVAENERDRIRERVRDVKRHRASQRLYNGGKRPFGYDIDKGQLVPNANEQDALRRARCMRANGDSLRSIAFVWMSEFGLDKYDAKTIQRILAREDGVSPLSLRGPAS
jgi:putative DNA-invertase from lambdoid prophage Rac